MAAAGMRQRYTIKDEGPRPTLKQFLLYQTNTRCVSSPCPAPPFTPRAGILSDLIRTVPGSRLAQAVGADSAGQTDGCWAFRGRQVLLGWVFGGRFAGQDRQV